MDFEDLKGLFPLLIFILTIVIDKSSRRKRKKERGHFPPLPDIEQPQEAKPQPEIKAERKTGKVYEEPAQPKKQEEKIPWYVEFPEDKKAKQQGRVYHEPPKEQPKSFPVYKEPVFVPQPAQAAFKPVAAMSAAKPKKPLFDGRMTRKRVLDGFVMAQILDKPRALKPYTDPY